MEFDTNRRKKKQGETLDTKKYSQSWTTNQQKTKDHTSNTKSNSVGAHVVCVCRGRAFVCDIWRISIISQKLRRQRVNTAETLCGRYLLPCHITYWLADNLGTRFLRSDSASSSTAMPSTSASTAPALKRFKFLPEKLQQLGSADDRSQSSSSSTCATLHAHIDQYLHELRASLPEKDVITFWRRRQAAYPLLAPLA